MTNQDKNPQLTKEQALNTRKTLMQASVDNLVNVHGWAKDRAQAEIFGPKQ